MDKNAVTKLEIEETFKKVKEVDERYEKFRSDFGKAINELAVQLKLNV